MELNSIMLMAAEGGQKDGRASSLIFIVLIIVVFYFFMIRPQMKKSKEQKKFRESLKKGDKIITIGGIHGKIIDDSNETTFTIEVEGGGKFKIERVAVATSNQDIMNEQK